MSGRPEEFHTVCFKLCNIICYFDQLSFDYFFGKEKFRTENWNLMKKQVPLKMQTFINHFVLKRQPADFFFPEKFIRWKQFKIFNKYDITKTWNLCLTSPLIKIFLLHIPPNVLFCLKNGFFKNGPLISWTFLDHFFHQN